MIRREAKLAGRKHPETPFPHPKLHRAGPNQLAVDLDWHFVLGGNPQAFGLKILQFRHPYGRAEDYVLEISNNVEICHSLKDNDIEQAVIDDSAFKKWEWPTIKTTISDEDERTFDSFRAF